MTHLDCGAGNRMAIDQSTGMVRGPRSQEWTTGDADPP